MKSFHRDGAFFWFLHRDDGFFWFFDEPPHRRRSAGPKKNRTKKAELNNPTEKMVESLGFFPGFPRGGPSRTRFEGPQMPVTAF